MMMSVYLVGFLIFAVGAFGLTPGIRRNAVIGLGCLMLSPLLLVILLPFYIALHVALGGAHP